MGLFIAVCTSVYIYIYSIVCASRSCSASFYIYHTLFVNTRAYVCYSLTSFLSLSSLVPSITHTIITQPHSDTVRLQDFNLVYIENAHVINIIYTLDTHVSFLPFLEEEEERTCRRSVRKGALYI